MPIKRWSHPPVDIAASLLIWLSSILAVKSRILKIESKEFLIPYSTLVVAVEKKMYMDEA